MLLLTPDKYLISGSFQLFFYIFVFLLNPPIVIADIYKWTDENGKVHFSDKPQSNDAMKVQIKKSPTVDPHLRKRQESREKLLGIYSEERKEKKLEQLKADNEGKQREVRCAKSKKQLQTAKDAGFLYEDTDDPKNPKILNSEERMKEIRKIVAQVKRWCM